MVRVVPCAKCERDRAVNEFGRCGVCGDMIAEVALQYKHPATIFLRKNWPLLLGLLLTVVGLLTYENLLVSQVVGTLGMAFLWWVWKRKK